MKVDPLLIACDFDGTVTRQDTLVEILDRFGSPAWREVQKKVVSGSLSIREGLQTEIGSVRASREEVISLLASRVEVDSSFPGFLHEMRLKGVPVVCLSGGFDLCVETVLKKANLWPLPTL
ncbi:MAG: HAD-IB family phosphatase, partial [Candidatus Omnitrophica bacterium]|nr:HAD-IB family phosphatase [Candidatus Omnitrophota bacterium]